MTGLCTCVNCHWNSSSFTLWNLLFPWDFCSIWCPFLGCSASLASRSSNSDLLCFFCKTLLGISGILNLRVLLWCERSWAGSFLFVCSWSRPTWSCRVLFCCRWLDWTPNGWWPYDFVWGFLSLEGDFFVSCFLLPFFRCLLVILCSFSSACSWICSEWNCFYRPFGIKLRS